jgi:hypothetical protein
MAAAAFFRGRFQAVQVRRGSPARRADQPARSGSTATTLSSNTASAENSSVTPVAVHAGYGGSRMNS